MARAKPVPVLAFAGPSGAALSSAVWSVFRYVALLESAGILVLKLNLAAMPARCISAWPNVRVNRRAEAGRLGPVGENVQRTADRAKVACRSASG